MFIVYLPSIINYTLNTSPPKSIDSNRPTEVPHETYVLRYTLEHERNFLHATSQAVTLSIPGRKRHALGWDSGQDSLGPTPLVRFLSGTGPHIITIKRDRRR